MNHASAPYRPTQALIHLDHLRHNLRELRARVAPGAFFCPMVKANAYGHGDVAIAKALVEEGVSTLGVGLIEEGLLLREAGIQQELLFFGIMDARGARVCLEHNLTPVLSSWEQIRGLVAAAQGRDPFAVHLKFDTGMHRLGFEPREAAALLEFFENTPQLQLRGILTHLHSAEDAADPHATSFQQLRDFQSLAAPFAKWNPTPHALNSAGLLNLARLKGKDPTQLGGVSLDQGVRPGLALYGVSPLPAGVVEQELGFSLKPVMSLRSKIVRVRRLSPGSGVSYGHRWRSSRESWIGVVPMGYADGYHRLLTNQSHVLLEGERVPLVGNVCMDYFMVDLTDHPRCFEPDSFLWKDVTLFGYDADGNQLPVEELATKAQTIPWEILTSVGERVPRSVKASGR